MPFIGATWSPNDLFFSHSFVQVDIATGGNEVFMTDPAMGPGPVSIGKHTPANLLLVDVGGGVWLFRNPSAPYIQGVALIGEIHYTTTLQDADLVNSDATFPSPNGQVVIFDPQNRRDFLNLTVGLHTDIGPLTSIRVGAVLPLREGPDQPFDAEVHVSVNRLY